MKKNMIRAMCLVLALCMGLSLVSCGAAANSGSASASGSASSAAPAVDYGFGLDENGYWKDLKALDYVTLPDYKNIEIPADKIAASDEDIEGVKKNMLQPYGEPTKTTEGEVKSGDKVNIDYVGTVDGVEFAGGNTNGGGADLTIGSGQYIPGFEDQLIGHKPGETVDVIVTLPEGYNDSEDKDGNKMVLANKEAKFTTTINYIAGEMVYPEFDDEFVKKNLNAQYLWTSAEEAIAGIRENLETMNKYGFIMDYLKTESKISEIPQTLVDTMVEINIQSAKATAAQYGMQFADFLTISGFADEDAFREAVAGESKTAAEERILFQAIAESEGLKIEQKDIDAAFAADAKAVVEHYGEPYVKMSLLNDKVSSLLMDEN